MATWYVSSAVSSSGNGTSWATAWKAFANIVWASINPGDVIEVDGGTSGLTYTDQLVYGASGTAGNPITIRASSAAGHNGQVSLFGGRTTPLPYAGTPLASWTETATLQYPVSMSTRQYVILDGQRWHGWRIYGALRDGISPAFAGAGAAHNTFRYLDIYDCGTGVLDGPTQTWSTDYAAIRLWGDNHLVEFCDLHDCGQDCFQTGNAVNHLTVRKTWMHFTRENPDYPGHSFNVTRADTGVGTHNDGYQVFTSSPTDLNFIDCLFGPGLMQGFISNVITSAVTIRQCLFFPINSKVSGGAAAGNAILVNPGVQSTGWTIDQVTIAMVYDVSNTMMGLYLEGTGHTITNSIFDGAQIGLNNAPTTSGVIQHQCIVSSLPNSLTYLDGTTVDPQFVVTEANWSSPPRFSELANADFTPQASAAIGKGCTDFTSVNSFLAFVGAPVPGQSVQDNFNRADATDISTSPNDQGIYWSQAQGTGTAAISSNTMLTTAASGIGNVWTIGSGQYGDVDQTVKATLTTTTSTEMGLVYHYQDSNNYWTAKFFLGNTFTLRRCVTGAYSSAASMSFTPSTGVAYKIRQQVTGTTHKAKIWQDGTGEPDWQLVATDPAVADPGYIGIDTFTAAGTITFDDYTALVPTLFATLSGRGTLSGALGLPPPPPAGPLTVTIGGSPVFVVAGTLAVDLSLGKRGSAQFTVKQPDTSTHYQHYQRVQITDQNGVVIFGGYIAAPKEQKPGYGSYLVNSVTCMDYRWVADKRVVFDSSLFPGTTLYPSTHLYPGSISLAKVYTSRPYDVIVWDLFNKYLAPEGVSMGAIFTGPLPTTTLYPSTTLYPNGPTQQISSVTFNYPTVTQALDALVTSASASGITFYWSIDQNKQFWFVPYTYITNSSVVDGRFIDSVNNAPYVEHVSPLFRNTQYVAGGTTTGPPRTEYFIGNNNTRTWRLAYATAGKPSIEKNNLVQSVGLAGTSGQAFYFQVGSQDITQDSNGTLLLSTDTLTVAYTPMIPNTSAAQNTAQVAAQRALDGTTGIVESVVKDTGITSNDDGVSEAESLLNVYSLYGTRFTFSTRTSGYFPGQQITVTYTSFGFSSTKMLIESVHISDAQDLVNIWYTIVAIIGPYDASWSQFFSRLLLPEGKVTAGSINVGV